MKTKTMIPLQVFCEHYGIDLSFLNSLHEFGLTEIVTVENVQYLKQEEIRDIERIITLHYELGINLEGIDVAFNLLRKLESLRQELNTVKNKLSVYENTE
jgi:hypothetical protein